MPSTIHHPSDRPITFVPISEATRLHFEAKQARLAFHGLRLTFTTARTLFSGAGVDAGTALLLRHLQETPQPDQVTNIVDIGSGYGPLGTVLHGLSRTGEDRRVTFADRDALALDYSRHNFAANNSQLNTARLAAAMAVCPSLGLDGVPADPPFDLVVSNVPGKAGEPVIDDLIARAASHGREGTMVGLVVVTPLAAQVDKALTAEPYTAMTSRASKTHVAFTARVATSGRHADADAASGPATPSCAASPSGRGANGFDAGLYDRAQLSFEADGRRWQANTVVGLPEFDSLNHTTALIYDAITGLKRQPLVVVGPGQGHRAVLAALTGFTVAALIDRDLLALRASDRMLTPYVDVPPQLIHTAETAAAIPEDLADASVVLSPGDKVHTPWLMAEAKRILAAMAKSRAQQLIIGGKAGPLGLLEAELVRRRLARVDYKGSYRGFRALRLVRR